LKPAGEFAQHRFQRSRIHSICRHHSQSNRIGEKFGQRELAVLHLGALLDGVVIGPHTRYMMRTDR
jgi:hypothetical protein